MSQERKDEETLQKIVNEDIAIEKEMKKLALLKELQAESQSN